MLTRIGKPQVRPTSSLNASRPAKQRQVRLSGQQQAELAARHEAGAFKKELARIYGIHVGTVRAIIKRSTSTA